MKREEVLKKMVDNVSLIAGTSGLNDKDEDEENPRVSIISELDFDYPTGHVVKDSEINIEKIKKNAFIGFKLKENERFKNEDDLLEHIRNVARIIKDKFLVINAKKKFDYLFLHNIFSHGRHIAAAKAFHDIIKETKIKIIAVNHDFYESYEDRYKPRWPKIGEYLDKHVPPPLGNIKHVTINSIWKRKLEKKINEKGVKLDSEIIVFPDTFNFNQKPWIKDDYNEDLLETFEIKDNDLIILQATRIVKRKAIELTIDLITELNKRKSELIGIELSKDRKFDENSDIVLAFAQKEEQDSKKYKEELIDRMNRRGVKYKFMYERIEHKRTGKNGKKIYSLWDAYVFAHLVSYPSTWEGFGNQFLEAVFAKKPIILFEYPVFKADIEKGGYHYISLGSNNTSEDKKWASIPEKDLKKAVTATIEMLLNPQTKQFLDKNYKTAEMYYGEKKLNELLEKCLE